MDNYCLGCMEPLPEGTAVCPECGYAQDTPPKEAYHLAPGSVLHGRYLIGRTIGYGGFGVTYIGRDLVLDTRVAIKEYLPSEFATRMPEQQTLSVYTGEAANQFTAGLKSFHEEAKRLAKFNHVPGVVQIMDTFEENKTSYIVMEYLDGETVKQKLDREGAMPYEEVQDIICAVLVTLEAVHPSGIIHRDISPANIFLTKDGKIKLLDFGAARYASAYHTKSLSVILKPGYAPEEQYRSRGNQGPWTDVYAVAATMYKMLTGLTPQESIERMHHDELKEPSKLKVKIDKNKENALMNALNIDAQTRTQTAKQLLEELSGGEDVLRHRVIQHKKDEGKWPLWMKTAVCAIPLLIIMSTMLIVSGGQVKTNDAFTTVPNVIGRQETDAREVFQGSDLQMVVAGTTPVDFGESGTVQSINPESGSFIRRFETVEVLLAVNETVFMPDVVYWDVDDAVQRLEEAGFNTKVEYEKTEAYAEDVVFWQQYPEGEGLPRNTLITIKAAVGAPGAQKDDLREVPDIVGMPVKQAAEVLSEAGFHLCITAEQNDSSAYGTVLSQTQAGETAPKGTVIAVTISIGNEFARMPDLFLKTKAEAAQLLAGLGLQVEYAYEVNNDYNEDLVLRQSEPAGTKIPLGGTVTLTLSKYEYANVPNVVGKNRQAAEKAITDAGFEVNVSDEVVYSETIQKGFILAQSATGQFPKGRTVTLTVSAGQTDKKATVPDVTGLNRSDAEYRLSTAEFMFADGGEAYSETVKKGLVISYSPTGSQRLGTVVTCVFSKGPEPKAVPNVAGQSQMAATNALTAIGMTVSTASAHSETVPYGSVISQSVSAGTLVDSGTPIVLTLSCGTAGKTVSAAEISNYPAGQYNREAIVEYRYTITTRQTDSRTVNSTTAPDIGSGWKVYDTDSKWGSWTAWTKGTPPAYDEKLMGVETKKQTEVTGHKYYFHYWLQTTTSKRSFFASPPSWSNFDIGYETTSLEFPTVAPGGWIGTSYNASGQTGYHIPTPYEKDGVPRIWFLQSTTDITSEVAYYRTRKMQYSYYYEKYTTSQPSAWTTDSGTIPPETTDTTVKVEKRTEKYYVVGKPF